MSYAAVPRTPQPPLTPASMVRADRGSLTELELLALDLLYRQGMTMQQAAHYRHRSVKTIEAQVANARRKLGAKNRFQLGYIFGQLSQQQEPS